MRITENQLRKVIRTVIKESFEQEESLRQRDLSAASGEAITNEQYKEMYGAGRKITACLLDHEAAKAYYPELVARTPILLRPEERPCFMRLSINNVVGDNGVTSTWSIFWEEKKRKDKKYHDTIESCRKAANAALESGNLYQHLRGMRGAVLVTPEGSTGTYGEVESAVRNCKKAKGTKISSLSGNVFFMGCFNEQIKNFFAATGDYGTCGNDVSMPIGS